MSATDQHREQFVSCCWFFLLQGKAHCHKKNRFFTEFWGKSSLGGASADAQSYWQGRFAACTFVAASLGLVGRGTVGALPQTPQGTDEKGRSPPLTLQGADEKGRSPPLTLQGADEKGRSPPLDPFFAIELVSLPCSFRVQLFWGFA